MYIDLLTGRAMTFSEVSRRCLYFFSNSEVNNGYGCTHPDQEEIEDGLGRCYDFACPLGNFENQIDG